MDLVSSLTVVDLVAGVSFALILNTFSTQILTVVHSFLRAAFAVPVIEALYNNSLVVLKNTELVWKPVVSTALIVLKPILSYALMILKPLGPMAVIVLDNAAKAMVIFGYMTAHTVLTVYKGIYNVVNFTHSMGVSITTSVQNSLIVMKDFSFSLAKIVKWIGYLAYQVVYGTSWLIDSCEQVGIFLRRMVFEAHTITWQDVYNISIPFAVVGAIVGYLAWRVYRTHFYKPSAPQKKVDEEIFVPRRSSRLARKRAFLYCSETPIISLPSEKTSSRTPTMAGGGQRTPNL